MKPRISALLPAYNSAHFIQETLDSLSGQALGDFTVLVSVDAGDDNTFDLCVSHARRDPRFRVIKQKARLGYVGNCNFLLDAAEADFACFAFHDDLLGPAFLEKLSVALLENPHAVLAFSDVLVEDEVTGQTDTWIYDSMEGLTDPIHRALQVFKASKYGATPNRGLFRLPLARSTGGMRRHGAGGYAPDLPWLFHLSLLGEFVRVPEILCFKRYKAQSLSKTWEGSKAQLHAALAACWREIWLSPLPLPQKLRLATRTKWAIRARLADLVSGR